MSKTELRKEIDQMKKASRKEQFENSAFVLTIKGLWTFLEGSALLVTSTFAIFQAYRQPYPEWGRDILYVAGVFVLYPAALLLSKFFRSAGRV